MIKRTAGELLLLALGLAAVLGVPALILGTGVWWVESRFGGVAAAVSLGGVLALLAWIGGSLFTHRIKQKTQSDMLDGLGELAGTVGAMSGVHRAQAQAALVDRRLEADIERRVMALADQRARLLLSDRAAADRAASAAPTWIDLGQDTPIEFGRDKQTAQAQAAAWMAADRAASSAGSSGAGFRYVE